MMTAKQRVELFGGESNVIRKRKESLELLREYERKIRNWKPHVEVIEDQRGTTHVHGVDIGTLRMNAGILEREIDFFDELLRDYNREKFMHRFVLLEGGGS